VQILFWEEFQLYFGHLLYKLPKYVIITLSADNHGEGGIFALYALVKRQNSMAYSPASLEHCRWNYHAPISVFRC
jgi:hypothetical protein